MMKQKFIFYTLLFFTFATSCKKQDLKLYDSASSIYFAATNPVTGNGNQGTAFSFGYKGTEFKDTVVNIIILSTGMPTNLNRPYQLTFTNTKITEGVDYKVLNQELSIKAGKVLDTLKIQFSRTAIMQTDTVLLGLELKENENFNTALNHKTIGSGTSQSTIYFTKFNFAVDDIVGKPWFWATYESFFDVYFGTYSRKKFLLMVSILNIDVPTVTAIGYIPPSSSYTAWANYMKYYLDLQAKSGNIIYEEDGITKMQMGISAQ